MDLHLQIMQMKLWPNIWIKLNIETEKLSELVFTYRICSGCRKFHYRYDENVFVWILLLAEIKLHIHMFLLYPQDKRAYTSN